MASEKLKEGMGECDHKMIKGYTDLKIGNVNVNTHEDRHITHTILSYINDTSHTTVQGGGASDPSQGPPLFLRRHKLQRHFERDLLVAVFRTTSRPTTQGGQQHQILWLAVDTDKIIVCPVGLTTLSLSQNVLFQSGPAR